MSRRNRIVICVGVIAVLVIGGGLAFVLFGGSDGPAALSFGDATTTTTTTTTTASDAGASASSTPAGPTSALTTVDGSWVVTDRSQAGYRVLEDRLGGAANVEAVGRTNKVTGGFTVAGTTVSGISITVDVASITSNSGLRDGRFRDSIMNASQFPTATFTAADITLDAAPADGATLKVPATGKLTLRGQSQDVSTTLQVKRSGGEVQILGSIPVKFSDYGIETPSPPGLSVRDNGTVEFLLVATPKP